MALINQLKPFIFLKTKSVVFPFSCFINSRQIARNISNLPSGIVTSHTTNNPTLEYYVYVSTSNNIFTNLALEDWIEKHVNLQHINILLLWRNNPCVVIGRHQNPWQESNIKKLLNDGIPIARRRSGGGCVYHDLGNLNCTFFTNKARYDRKHNLRLIADVLSKHWKIGAEITERDDVIIDNKYKVSGTAARLIKNVAYHHFTLLIEMDLNKLGPYLSPTMDGLYTKATESVRAKVKNLKDYNSQLSCEDLMKKISERFLSQGTNYRKEFVVIDPSNTAIFPGVAKYEQELKSWDWIFGKTPKFILTTRVSSAHAKDLCIQIELTVEKGYIQQAAVSRLGVQDEEHSKNLTEALHGTQFWPQHISMSLAGYLNRTSVPSKETNFLLAKHLEQIFIL